ncbi:MAG: hypothetical protein ACE5RB_02380 [Nitrosopumilus sp.]
MTYYVSKINTVNDKSETCVNCGKAHLETNIIIEKSGMDTLLCPNCETLMVVTNHSDNKPRLKVKEGEAVTIRHNIRN